MDVVYELDSILDQLDPQSLAILVGAGISVAPPTLLPTASQFLADLYDVCLPSSVSKELFRSSRETPLGVPFGDLRFEAVLGILQNRFDPTLAVFDFFTSRVPNRNHYLLADLARRGALIITTNFDNLVETAARPHLAAIAAAEEFETVDHSTSPENASVWHLHGIIADPRTGEDRRETITASIRDCWRSRALFSLSGTKRAALSRALADRDLLVVGYSGSDDYDICPALEAISSERHLVWVDHGNEPLANGGVDISGVDLLMIDALPDGDMWYRHPGRNIVAAMIYNGHRQVDRVTVLRSETTKVLDHVGRNRAIDEALSSMGAEQSGQLGQLAYPPPNPFQAWALTYLPTEYDKYLFGVLLCRLGNRRAYEQSILREALIRHDPVSTEIGDDIRSFIELSIMALEVGDVSIGFTREQEFQDFLEGQPTVKAVYLTAFGRVLASQGKYDVAIDCLRQSLAIRDSLKFTEDLDAAIHALAEVLFEVGYPNADLSEATIAGERALEWALATSNPEGIARCHLLLARICERQESLQLAEEHYSNACSSAKGSGIASLVARTSGEYGLFLWIEGGITSHFNAAIFLAEAFRIHFSEEDWQALFMVSSNLALCLESLGETPRSLLADCTAFRCAGAIGDSETRGIALARINDAAPRVGLGRRRAGIDDEIYVTSVQKMLIDQGILI